MTREAQKEKLSPLQQRFVKEYVANGMNGQNAYLTVSNSSSKKSAAVQATKLLKVPKVKDAIKMFTQEAIGPQIKAVRENIEFWVSIRDAKKEVGLVRLDEVKRLLEADLSDEQLQMLDELDRFETPEYRATDRISVSKEIAKYAQMYDQPLTDDDEGPVKIVDDIG